MTFPKRTGTQLRNAELAQIHIARAQLGLDDETYRAVLWAVGRVKSSKDLDWTGRKKLLEHFKAKGWRPSAPRKAKAAKPVEKGQEGLVRRLWDGLYKTGKVNDASDAALCTWLKRNKLPERLEWLDGVQINRVIESLKKWLDRP